MKKLIIKNLPTFKNAEIVTISSEVFQELVTYINKQTDIINALIAENASQFERTEKQSLNFTKSQKIQDTNIKILADALGGIIDEET